MAIVDRNPLGRFDGLARTYAQHRPNYPEALVDRLLERAQLPPGAMAADLGSGTGISSRLIAERGLRVLGIEPNAQMRAQAQAHPASSSFPAPTYRDGRAEATGLDESSVALVFVAQAFHWFDPDKALREFHRILKPAGLVGLAWNERDEGDPFTAAYGAIVGAFPGAAEVEGSREQSGGALLQSKLFQKGLREVFPNVQPIDAEGMLGRAFSASYAPKEPAARQVAAAQLREAFARYQQNGQVSIHYVSSLYSAVRSS